jgi:hypothetical protein
MPESGSQIAEILERALGVVLEKSEKCNFSVSANFCVKNS